ncbi:hypothetical protein [Planctellipticum variicoloris]|uniref:hypothetical protein n=1 Tax=Planctellipticum variicoloris TaxID=3064265 RepID=UPI003013C487|nr:hypothetical protein SH412_004637 [Planctomycetaceae bacterium SH412]
MASPETSNAVERAFSEPWRVERALDRGVRRAAEFHRAFGVPMVGWENGQVVHYDPANVIEELDRKLASYPSEDVANGGGNEATGEVADRVIHGEV